jgi:hypothetical protein
MNMAGTMRFVQIDEVTFSGLGTRRVLAKVLICDVLFSVSLYLTGSKSAISTGKLGSRESKWIKINFLCTLPPNRRLLREYPQYLCWLLLPGSGFLPE